MGEPAHHGATATRRSITVIQSAHVWLPRTEPWLYDQVRLLPGNIKSHVVCENTEFLDQFPWEPLHVARNLPWWRYTLDRGARKMKLRPYLRFQVTTARKSGARLIHSHFGNRGWEDVGVARSAGLKHIVTFYGHDVTRLPTVDPRWRSRYRTLFRHVNCVLCEGDHMLAAVVKLGCPPEKLRVHHLGVSVDTISFRPASWEAGRPLRFLIAATFVEKKGIPYAVEALGRLQHDLPIELTIIGDTNGLPESDAEKNKILKTLELHGLLSKTRLLGFRTRDELFEEARTHHVFLAPSVTAADGDLEGGAPVSIIDMSAAGVLVLSTRHCDIPGIVKHGETGLLADERDVEGLLARMRWLIDHAEDRPRMLSAARTHVEKHFNANVQAEQLACVYEEVTNP